MEITPEKIRTTTPFRISVRRINNNSGSKNTAKEILEFAEETKRVNEEKNEVIEKNVAKEELKLILCSTSEDETQKNVEQFASGYIYWGQIYNYSYWPCMVCPDPEGQIMSTQMHKKQKPQVMVHVRFFADHGRRNWVKCENMLPFEGLDKHKERMQQTLEKFGEKSNQYKVFVPTRAKLPHWNQAIDEAQRVLATALPQRLEIFEEILNETNEKLKLKRRSRSLQKNINDDTLSQAASCWTTVTALYPPDEQVRKKRKIEIKAAEVETTALAFIDTEDENNFKKFFDVMRNFVLEDHTDSKIESVLKTELLDIWALKQNKQAQPQLDASSQKNEYNHEKELKRLSKSLKFIKLAPLNPATTKPAAKKLRTK